MPGSPTELVAELLVLCPLLPMSPLPAALSNARSCCGRGVDLPLMPPVVWSRPLSALVALGE